jgi:hypothetical protein
MEIFPLLPSAGQVVAAFQRQVWLVPAAMALLVLLLFAAFFRPAPKTSS